MQQERHVSQENRGVGGVGGESSVLRGACKRKKRVTSVHQSVCNVCLVLAKTASMFIKLHLTQVGGSLKQSSKTVFVLCAVAESDKSRERQFSVSKQ